MKRMYVDAMNVIGSRPNGWWRDRDAAVHRLLDELHAHTGTADTEVVLVVDGRPVEDLAEGRHGSVVVRYATRRGPDAADDRIVELVAATAADDVEVVTADRELRERVQALGARVFGPRWLLDQLRRADCDGGEA